MKFSILTEGGRDIGFGHIARCVALYQGFEEEGITPELLINGDETVKDSLKGINCSIFNWLSEEEKTFNIIGRADVVIIDSYLASLGFYNKVSRLVETSVYVDDYKRLNYPKGIIVNGNIYAQRSDYPCNNENIYLLGPEYVPLRKAFWDVPGKNIRENVEAVMITAGGSDKFNITPRILKTLVDNFPGFTKNVIIGKGFENIDRIEKATDRNTKLIRDANVGDMQRIMLDSDIAISAGGQTLYELARVGTPTIGIYVAKNQRLNLEYWQKNGFIEYLGLYKDNNLLDKMTTTINRSISYEKRVEQSKIGRSHVDGKGVERIVGRILSASVRTG
ncbi:PseG/SpsG family protein [Candidatus Omnitrophota bacterium]